MKKFLFVTLPSNDLGLLAQSLPIARELQNRGQQVAFCNPGRAPRQAIAAAGFENFLPRWPMVAILTGDMRLPNFFRLLFSWHLKRDLGILSAVGRHLKERGTSEIWNIDHFQYVLGMGNEEYVRATIAALVDLVNDYEPDAIVNFWNPFMRIAAKICRKPLVSVIQADLHPRSRGFIWWKEPPPALPTPVPAINAVLAEYGLQPIGKSGELSIGDLTLILGMPETDPLPDAADATYIGPLLWQKENEKPPAWIDDLRHDRPIIWIYPGNLRYLRGCDTPFDGMVILQACIEALKNMPVQVILSTGLHSLPKSVLPLPANFRHAAFVPGLAMAEKSDLIIHHGGYGSCQTGLYAGTPAVIIPTYSERESNARRVAAVGAGDFELPTADDSGKKVDVEELRAKIEHVLADPSYKENAVKISKKMRTFGGAAEAARLIENFMLAWRSRNGSRY